MKSAKRFRYNVVDAKACLALAEPLLDLGKKGVYSCHAPSQRRGRGMRAARVLERHPSCIDVSIKKSIKRLIIGKPPR